MENLDRQKTILVVDDDEAIRDLLKRILNKEGYHVSSARDGSEALEILKTNSVDIVLSDMNMPNLSGFELLKQIREVHPTIGVIIMTSYGDIYSIKDSLLLGADEYICKPFKSQEIVMIIEKVYWRILSVRNALAESSS